ncbi:DNA-directed RNA polymerase subunit D [Candidatus Bathyarchaeota archaeon]|nr:DNA-directed RNA polymerase subunit D [Candidatus Bathyarchaeota archaeon]
MMEPAEKAVEEAGEYRSNRERKTVFSFEINGVGSMNIKTLKEDDTSIHLLIKGTNAAFMNTLRRIILTEVPTMAIDEVVVIENSSVLRDEFVAHRIGLMPLKTDLDTYNLPEACNCGSEFGCNLCRVSLTLESESGDHTITVYSGDFKSDNPSVVPVSNRIPITKLAPEQKVRLEAYARLGKGKDHARWQPVAVCTYRYLPIIKINGKSCDLCEKCIKVCPRKVLRKTGDEIVIHNIEDCSLCQDCVDACEKTPNAIEVTWDDESYTFNLESTEALKPRRILQEALKILDEKLNNLLEQLKGVQE